MTLYLVIATRSVLQFTLLKIWLKEFRSAHVESWHDSEGMRGHAEMPE